MNIMSLVAVEQKKKQEKIGKKEITWIDNEEKRKVSACVFESSLGNQTNLAT